MPNNMDTKSELTVDVKASIALAYDSEQRSTCRMRYVGIWHAFFLN